MGLVGAARVLVGLAEDVWGCLWCPAEPGGVFILGSLWFVVPLSTVSVARVETRDFRVCGYLFLSHCSLSLSQASRAAAMEGAPSWEESQPPFCVCCLLPRGWNPLLVGLRSRGENCRKQLNPVFEPCPEPWAEVGELCLGSVPGPAEGETLQAEICFRALSSLVAWVSSTCFGEGIKHYS